MLLTVSKQRGMPLHGDGGAQEEALWLLRKQKGKRTVGQRLYCDFHEQKLVKQGKRA